MVYAALNPAQADEVLGLILDEARALLRDSIDARQLAKVKEQLKSSYILSLENVVNRMMGNGRNLLLLDRVITTDELLQKIDAISLDMWNELAARVFRFEQMSLAAVGDGGRVPRINSDANG
jgi:predicted Zn-dependent peptidase